MKANTRLHIRFAPSWYPYFLYVGCKQNKQFCINIFCFCFDIHQVYKDWMIKEDKIITLDDGRRFETWSRNPKYVDEEVKTIAIPKWW